MDLPCQSTLDGDGDIVPLFLELCTHLEDISGGLERFTADFTGLLNGLYDPLLLLFFRCFVGVKEVEKLPILLGFFLFSDDVPNLF